MNAPSPAGSRRLASNRTSQIGCTGWCDYSIERWRFLERSWGSVAYHPQALPGPPRAWSTGLRAWRLAHPAIDSLEQSCAALEAELPDELTGQLATPFPKGWWGEPGHKRSLGSAWMDGGEAPVLAVPRALMRVEMDFLLNPSHCSLARSGCCAAGSLSGMRACVEQRVTSARGLPAYSPPFTFLVLRAFFYDGAMALLSDAVGNCQPITLCWEGPFAWPGFERIASLPPIPHRPGVYLQTFEYRDGYLIYLAGITRRAVPARFREHTRKYLNGDYNVLDIDAAQQGVRQEVWHGWGYARAHREEFEVRKREILEAVHRQLAGFRIFVADVGEGPRLLERLEAAIMNHLYQQPPPICDIPDRGMYLAPRRSSEPPIRARNVCGVALHGLPAFLEI